MIPEYFIELLCIANLVLWIVGIPIIIGANWLFALCVHKRICRDRGWRTNWKGDILD